MKKRWLFHPVLLVMAWLMAPLVWADPISTSFGIDAMTGTGPCNWNADHTRCRWGIATYNGTRTVSETDALSTVTDGNGTAYAYGQIDPGSYLPELHAFAAGSENGMADANVWGVQGYRYLGTEPFLLELTITFESLFNVGSGSPRFEYHSQFYVSIFDTTEYLFSYINADFTNGGTLCPILQRGGPECENSPEVFASSHEVLRASGIVTLTISRLLNSGDEFFVGAFLDATACCAATVDSSHTLRMSFNDYTQLGNIRVPGSVPEPAGLALLSLGLLAAAGGRRRLQC